MSRFIPKAQVEHNKQSLRRTHLESELRHELAEIQKMVEDNTPGAYPRLRHLGLTKSHARALLQKWIYQASKRDAQIKKAAKDITRTVSA